MPFRVEAGRVQSEAGEDQVGHAVFRGDSWSVQYRGTAGFRVATTKRDTEYVARPSDAVARVVGLIRFRGHRVKGGYGVRHGSRGQAAAAA